MADLRVYESPHVAGCFVARCEVCPKGWVTLPRPTSNEARAAGVAHMARAHGGAWSGEVAA